ncbi:precorrin-2 C(20)-methyltransferase [Prochlorococcus sp. MIT 1307]|uniref:precorrin-2 C(20)-methyltransferase n=1 Tax=Prochlorococcus sp. MIT 1307 TaxID=3096219 RepID=UPI002A75101D|nr:precorrin-2 C(20)-methyltransferase [Prochlorococcus sp. MIT 1307]
MTKSSLTFVGVGPGDPSLLTLSAVEAIKNSTLVAYPVSRKEDVGIAATIASKWITAEKRRLPLLFPMVSDVPTRKLAWKQASEKLASSVAEGEEVVFLCQGDVSLFASASYVLLYIQNNYPHCPIRLIPGVTAISAAAAAGGWPLALQRDQLLVLPTPDDSKNLERIIDEAACCNRVLALMKLGSRWTWVRPLLEKKGLLKESLFAQKIGLSDQQVLKASKVSATTKPYFSLLLVRQGWPEVLP